MGVAGCGKIFLVRGDFKLISLLNSFSKISLLVSALIDTSNSITHVSAEKTA